MNIDIGCGGTPKGFINIDLYMFHSPDTVQYIDVKSISNFINASITDIPVRDNTGSVTVYHVIEHILEVNDAIKELIRISNGKVVIVVPNHPIWNEHPQHLHSWSRTSLKSYLECFFDEVDVSIKTITFIPRLYKLIQVIPMFFFLRRKIYQFISNIIGHDLVAICYINKKLDGKNERE